MILFSPQFWLFAVLIGLALFALFRRSPVVPLALYFTWLTVEDLVRKLWGNDMTVYFAKFIWIAVISVHLLRMRGWRQYPLPRVVSVPFFLWTLIVLGNSFNPNLYHPLESLAGIHADLLYLLIFLPAGYWLVRTHREAMVLLITLNLLVVFPTIAAVLQQIYGPEFLNMRVLKGTELVAVLERGFPGLPWNIIRVSSVFADPGRFAGYSVIMLWLGVGSCLLFPHIRVVMIVGLAAAGMAAVDVFLAGNRRVFVTALAVALIFVLLWVVKAFRTSQRPLRWLARYFLRWMPIPIIVFALLYFIFPDAISKMTIYFVRSLLGTEKAPSEISTRVPGYAAQLNLIFTAGLLGHGTGAVALGKQYLERRLGISVTPPASENGFADRAWTYGIVGLAIWVWLLVALLIALWQAGQKTPEPQRNLFIKIIFSYALFWFTAIQLLGSALQDYLFQSYFWFAVGMALRCPYWAEAAPQHVHALAENGVMRP